MAELDGAILEIPHLAAEPEAIEAIEATDAAVVERTEAPR